MAWNTGRPRRKFLVSPGRYLAGADSGDPCGTGELVFWGEWEGPSRVERRWPRSGRHPRVLHRPHRPRSVPTGTPHDTDPWVFGEPMRYGYGKQVTGPTRRPTAMQDLDAGSVICFGSTVDGEFRADTVFVVADSRPWVPAEEAGTSDAFAVCVASAIVACGVDAHTPLTLYRGATARRPVHGMFSFVPARPAAHPSPRFARPAVRLPGLVDPASTQSARGSGRPLPITAVREAWTALRDQVLAADLVLATHLDTPEGSPPRQHSRRPEN